MATAETSAPSPTTRALRRLIKGFERRSAVDGAGRIELEKQLLAHLSELRDLLRTPSATHDEAPPRQVALAMATALLAQPHLGILASLSSASSTDISLMSGSVSDSPVLLDAEAITGHLAIHAIELNDLREDIDRRLARALKQSRALWWLWHHFGLPGDGALRLYEALLPAVAGSHPGRGLLARGAQLYAVAENALPPPIEALYLSWLPVDPDRTIHPLRAFRHGDVADSLRKTVARGIGATLDELDGLLDRMLVVLPRTGASMYVLSDVWRSRGFAALCDSAATRRARPLTDALAPDDIDFDKLFVVSGGSLLLHNPTQAFDGLAAARGNTALQQILQLLTARALLDTGPVPPGAGDLALFDIEAHLRAITTPLFAWASAAATAMRVAEKKGVPANVAKSACDDLYRQWRHQFEAAWLGAPHEGEPHSVQALILTHLITVQDSLQNLFALNPDPRGRHQDVLALFAGALFARRPLEALLADAHNPNSATYPFHGDAIGVWFWNLWTRVLDGTAEVTMEI